MISRKRITNQDEDAATAALAHLMCCQRAVMDRVIKVFAPDRPEAPEQWVVSSQHPTRLGRSIDIFIRSAISDFSIVVEAKIRDGMKPYQFDPYIRYAQLETGQHPSLVWLVCRPRTVIGSNVGDVRIVTWNELHAALTELTEPQCVEFCADLVSSGIVLTGAINTRRKTYKGCKADHAVGILRGIRNSFNDLEGDVEEGANTPLGLHVGRNSWNLSWKRRVWLYFEPTTSKRDVFAPYGFVCHLLLYHAQDDDFEPLRIEKWSITMAKLGLILSRNVHGTWNRQYKTLAPIKLTSKVGVKIVGAARPVDMIQNFDWQDDTAAIAAGRTYLSWGLEVIDQCLAEALK